MKQKLMLTTTLMHSPALLLLDEPTTGVDPVSRREFWDVLAGLNAAGTTVLVATPYMDEAERCTHVAFMADGRVTHTGTPAEVKALVPGTVLEVSCADLRAALDLLQRGPQGDEEAVRAVGVRSAHLLGDVVRVLVADAAASDLAAWLRASGLAAEVRTVAPDMEAAFAYLAEAS